MPLEQLGQFPYNYTIAEAWNCDPQRIDDSRSIHELASAFVPDKKQLLVHPFQPIGKTFIAIDKRGNYAGGHFWPEEQYRYGLVVHASRDVDPGIAVGANPLVAAAMTEILKPGTIGAERPPNIQHFLARTLIPADPCLLNPDTLLSRLRELTDASHLTRVGGIAEYVETDNGPLVVAMEGLASSHFTLVLRSAYAGITEPSDTAVIPYTRFSTNGTHSVEQRKGRYQEVAIPGTYEMIIDALTCEKDGLGWNPMTARQLFNIQPYSHYRPPFGPLMPDDRASANGQESSVLARQIYML